MNARRRTACAACVLLAAACSSGGDSSAQAQAQASDAGRDRAAPGGDDAGDNGGDDGSVPCDTGVYVGSVSGKILDTSGKPPATRTITVCGGACVTGMLDPDGTFTIAPHFCYKPNVYYAVPVFIFHGEPDYANVVVDFVPQGAHRVDSFTFPDPIYTAATSAMAKGTYDPKAPFSLDDGKGFGVSAAAGSITMPFGQTTVALAAVDLSFFPLGKGKGGETLSALYVVVPVGAKVGPAATVRFPNTAKLAASAAVELLAIGDIATNSSFPSGTLGVIGTGRVTSDGVSVESVPPVDPGLVMLGWIGYRAKH